VDDIYLSLSMDQYHSGISMENVETWRQFAEEIGTELYIRGDIERVIGNGRGYYISECGVVAKDAEVQIDGDYVTPDILYIGATGNVLLGCDYSFEDQEEFKICTVFDDIESAIREKLCQPSTL
jgi:hypothetical protein